MLKNLLALVRISLEQIDPRWNELKKILDNN